jgi:hypothetical protein
MPRWGIFFFEYTIYGRLNAQYEYGSRLMNESQRTMTTNDGTKHKSRRKCLCWSLGVIIYQATNLF